MSSLKKETNASAAPEFWRSIAELEQRPDFIKFLEQETESPALDPELADPWSRRGFMQLMGASLAFAGVVQTGCRWDEKKLVPIAHRPDGYVPGVPKYFATAFELGDSAQALLVKSFDGRPIKVEGNPDHAASRGATSMFAQASILELYDPDRSSKPSKVEGGRTTEQSWAAFDEFAKKHFNALKGDASRGLRVLAEASSSPTMARLKTEFLSIFPRAKWHEYEALSRDSEYGGTKIAFGSPYRVHYDLASAEVVVAVDDDLFAGHPDSVRLASDFAKKRRPDAPSMARLYAIESVFSTTGAMADHRMPLRHEHIVTFLADLDAKVSGASAPKSALGGEADYQKMVAAIAADLKKNPSKTVVTVGYRQPPLAHALAARINETLGNIGSTVSYTDATDRPNHVEDIADLAQAMAGGQVQTLVILGGNPVYNAPADLAFADALGKVEQSIHLGAYHDETSARCTWHLPRAHYLESWGDCRTFDGTVTLVQPLIQPLYDGRTASELVELLLRGQHVGGDVLVKQTAGVAGPKAWNEALHNGFVARSAPSGIRPPMRPFAAELTDGNKSPVRRGNGDLEVVFVHSSQLYDGRFANNAWLHEVPDFMTKSVWDNYALVSPKTAHALGIENDTLIKVTVGATTLELPAYVMPGQAPFSLAIPLGYGRTRAGVVGGHSEKSVEPIGVDAYKLRSSGAMYAAYGAKVQVTGKPYTIGNTQEHWSIDGPNSKSIEDRVVPYPDPEADGHHDPKRYERALIKRTTLDSFKENPSFAKKNQGPVPKPLWRWHKYEGRKWGMTTDLSSCTGCNACIIACQSENNIPVVGKKQVLNTREMHWIRIDRYFSGDMDNPQVVHQPVACQQCENAPCEQVCPVGATIHSSEGLNDMVYNRCVGTRYCSNNCPYKVRRFNFLHWNELDPSWKGGAEVARNKVRQLLFNPEVTVRSRGVMEKCTFCVQRIEAVKIAANNAQRPIADGEIKTACQQACPSDAIVFGDLNDPNSRVAKLQQSSRAYELLGEFHAKPRNMYLAQVKNPNPDLVAKRDAAHSEHHE